MMHWWQFALLGACGGAVVEVLSLFKWFTVWQSARRSDSGTVRVRPPQLSRYVDVPAHAGMLVLRALLGAASSAIFAAGGQLKGAYVAVALGFCGPALLERLGELPQIASVVAGDQPVPDRSGDAEAHLVKSLVDTSPQEIGTTEETQAEAVHEH